ncbi:MAG TPA: 4-demethylwyosine synthase TYW1 [Candidatus Nanoarchaeia archaeon]|nr:4-demethylwyosine synthase TYW1 [Candidatus Nanoarchaeia archaeon]
MLTPAAKAELENQHYRIVGSHSAVKTCGWTKNMIRGTGGCYKLKFYGIMSHQCMQMTTSISCANRCTFCWRGYKAPVSKEWKWEVDDPQKIFEKSVEAHHSLLVGFNGSASANKALYAGSKHIKHVALSLTGEPIIYPKMNELLRRFNKEGISTFIVTNGQYPEQIQDLAPVTQLYVSMDAPNKELMKQVDLPLFSDFWERFLASLDALAQRKDRTCVRLTIIKGINDVGFEEYAELINRSNTDFIEVKAYMHVGESKERLQRENMPLHEEVVNFSKALAKRLDNYELVSEHIPSRVVMFAKKKFKVNGTWKTWIDFKRWHELVNSGEKFAVDDYLKNTPQVGISGKGTLDSLPKEKQKIFTDEKTAELSFYE